MNALAIHLYLTIRYINLSFNYFGNFYRIIVLRNIQHDHYDLIWVDKAIYLSSKTTQFLKSHTDCLIHYTPDPAFTYHQSRHFYESLSAYDFVVTTKSFEIDSYKEAVMKGRK